MQRLPELAAIIKEVCGIVSPVEPMDLLFDDYRLEPMDLVELRFAIHERLGIDISDRDIHLCATVRDILGFIESPKQ